MYFPVYGEMFVKHVENSFRVLIGHFLKSLFQCRSLSVIAFREGSSVLAA